MTKLSIALVGLLFTSHAVAGCFEGFPGIAVEKTQAFGEVAWSPLMSTAEIRAWLETEGFTEVVLDSPEPDTFWVRGACLAQVSGLVDSDQSWLIGSELGQILWDVLETRDVTS